MTTTAYSVIIPVFDEEKSLPELYRRVTEAMEKIGAPYEMIFVDDGSRDASLPLLRSFLEKDHRVKIISFSRNFGQQPAVTAGINLAQGGAAIILDADLQDPPELIEQMIGKWKEGFEVVYAVRTRRKENLIRRAAYAFFYRLLRKMAAIEIPLDAGDFCLIDRKVMDCLNSLPEKNRFVRGLRSWVGFRQTGLQFEREERYSGDSKYTLGKLLKLALDGILSFSHVPLKVFTFTGLVFCVIGLIDLIILCLSSFVSPPLPRLVLAFSTMVFILGGIQLTGIGILGEYLARVYDEVKGRPLYVVKEMMGFDRRKGD